MSDRKVVWPERDAPTFRRMVVIEVAFLRGKGADDTDPVRRVARYYDPETDELLWECDPAVVNAAVWTDPTHRVIHVPGPDSRSE